MRDAHRKDAESVRELACSLFMLGLLFGKETSKGDNVGIDLLLGYRSHVAVVLRHVLELDVLKMDVCSVWRAVIRVSMALEGGVIYAG